MNIRIVKPQAGPQAAFIQCTADVVCYGGARGGGKSWAIALDFWLHAERHGEDARGLILRKTREDLKDFIDTAGHMYAGSARYSEKGNFFSAGDLTSRGEGQRADLSHRHQGDARRFVYETENHFDLIVRPNNLTLLCGGRRPTRYAALCWTRSREYGRAPLFELPASPGSKVSGWPLEGPRH